MFVADLAQRLVKGKQLYRSRVRVGGAEHLRIPQPHAQCTVTALIGRSRTRCVHQNLPHRAGYGVDQMRAVLRSAMLRKLQIGFVHQTGGIERMAGIAGDLPMRNGLQFFVKLLKFNRVPMLLQAKPLGWEALQNARSDYALLGARNPGAVQKIGEGLGCLGVLKNRECLKSVPAPSVVLRGDESLQRCWIKTQRAGGICAKRYPVGAVSFCKPAGFYKVANPLHHFGEICIAHCSQRFAFVAH